jgi:hypothetical protein
MRPLDERVLALGLLLSAICGWTLLTIARSGVVKGRMGGVWARTKNPATYWLCVASLVAGLASAACLLAASLGASRAAAMAVGFLVGAGSLLAVGLFGRRATVR